MREPGGQTLRDAGAASGMRAPGPRSAEHTCASGADRHHCVALRDGSFRRNVRCRGPNDACCSWAFPRARCARLLLDSLLQKLAVSLTQETTWRSNQMATPPLLHT